MTTKVCARCKAPVSYENVSDGYFAVCPEHDADLYEFETEEVTSNVHPLFTEIVDGFMGMRALKPAPDAAEYHVPVDPAEIAQLLGSVYRDAHAAGYSDGWQAGLVQGSEDGERASDAKHDDTIKHMVIRYGELWGQARRTISDMECVIRQLAEMDNGQIKATLQGSIWSLQAQLDKGDK